MMKLLFAYFIALILSVSLFGCITSPPLKEELNSFIEDHKKRKASEEDRKDFVKVQEKRKASIKEKKKAIREKGINNLIVEESQGGFTVSVDLDKASIPEVVHRIFEKAPVPYLLDDTFLHGNISARFDKLPLLVALNLILKPIMLSAKNEDGIVVIYDELDNENQSDKEQRIQREVVIKNLDTDTVSKLLKGLYPVKTDYFSKLLKTINPEETNTDEPRKLNFGFIPDTNTVYLDGTEEDVLKTIKLLAKADREVKHVMIEVIVVDFDSDEFKKLEANITNLASGEFSGVNLKFGSFAGKVINFTRKAGANNPTKFTALIDILISDGEAQIISNPYIGTLSGKTAEILITVDRYVITEEAITGAAITVATPVTSGMIMTIAPTVLPDNKIQMIVDVEDSQFVNAAADIAVEVQKNSAKTVMQVEDGQTIIIGGLVLKTRSWENTGFPLLRRIPLLNIFFAKQLGSTTKREVVIYVTPYIMDDTYDQPGVISRDFETLEK